MARDPLADRHAVCRRRHDDRPAAGVHAARRKTPHLYVSVWYMGAALFWFPMLYIVAKIPGVHFGVEQATMNWWFGHNVLGLFYTPMSHRRRLLLPAQGDRPAGAVLQPVAAGLLDAGLLLRPGRRAPPDRRADSRMADHAVDRAEHHDDHPGRRVLAQPAPDAEGAFRRAQAFADAALHRLRRDHVHAGLAAGFAGGAADDQRHDAFHPLHGRPCAPGHVRLRDRW